MKKTFKLLTTLLILISISSASVSIKSMSGHPTPDVISMRPYMELINESDEILNLTEIVIDYYLYEEGLSAEDLSWEAYWNNEELHYEMNFFDLPEVIEKNGLKASIKCQISFTQETSLGAGTSLKMQHGIYKTGWNFTFDERDDWSFAPNSNYSYNEHIVVTNHVSGEVLFGNSIEGNTVPRPYAVSVNWIGEHTFDDLKDVNIKEGDAFLNISDKISYIYYQEKWTLLSDVETDLSSYATKNYVDNAVIIGPNSIDASQISKNHLTDVNADFLDGLHANEIIEAASGSTGGIDAEAKGYLKSIDEKLSVLISLQYQNSTNPIPEGMNVDDYYAVRKILDANQLYHVQVVTAAGADATGRVVSLSLNGKDITILPQDVGKLTELKVLNLGNNRLEKLPSSIGSLTNLEQLFLRYNNLKTIPEEIKFLTNLRFLIIESNQLESLPESLQDLPNIIHIEAWKNNLCGLSNEFEIWINSKHPAAGWKESQDCN